jgi:hypothetical protein
MAKRNAVPKICYDRVIPSALLATDDRAARDAAVSRYVAAVNEHAAPGRDFAPRAFAIHGGGALDASHPVHVARMALINRTKWDGGYNLRCRFLDGSRTQRRKVEAKAHLWEEYANIKIAFGDDPDAEVRISFQADDGSWSGVGKECLNTSYFPKYQPTMNYGWLKDDTDAKEYERVVVHEFGHALGCIHEHQSPSEKLRWNKAAVYEAFSGPPNYWSKADIDSNILQKYSPKGISFTIFDRKSIMLYQFDGSLFTDGKGTPENTKLSDMDKQMIGQMYPRASAAARSAR